MTPTGPQRFGFVQFDFAGSLGLATGRFLVRPAADNEPVGRLNGEAAKRVLVVEDAGAPPKSKRRFGRSPGTTAEDPVELDLTRVTAIFADERLDDEAAAERWLDEAAAEGERRDGLLREAVVMLNRAIHAHAVAAGDPYIQERRPEQAAAIRIGHGLGEELAEGRYTQALPVEVGRRRRRARRGEAAEGQERVAALIGGREEADICDTFVLRCRADLDAGRTREAAVGLTAAVEAMLVELEGALADPGHRSDMEAVRSRREEAARLAEQARHDRLAPGVAAELEAVLAICERILRRRRLMRG